MVNHISSLLNLSALTKTLKKPSPKDPYSNA